MEIKNKIKILFLDHTPFIGGAQISLYEHLKKINRGFFEPLIVCSKNAKILGLVDLYRKNRIKYYFISFGQLKIVNPIIIFRLLKSIFDLIKIMRKENPDLVFGNTIRADIVGSLAAFFTNKNIIWFIQDYTFPRLLFKLLYFIPKKIFYVSESVANYYKVRLNDKNKVVYIWRNFYKEAEMVGDEEIKQKRKELGLDESIVVGFIGRLVGWKGAQILINAMELLLNRGIKNIKCVVIGTGIGQKESNEEKLKRMVNEKKLNNIIIFPGFQKNIPLYMKLLDIFCLTSIEPEPFSSVVIEAMMAKIPVIGSDIGGTPEIIKNRETGILTKAGDFKDLSNAIEELVKDKSLKDKIVNNAYNYVLKYNTVEYAAEKLENEYLKIFNVIK